MVHVCNSEGTCSELTERTQISFSGTKTQSFKTEFKSAQSSELDSEFVEPPLWNGALQGSSRTASSFKCKMEQTKLCMVKVWEFDGEKYRRESGIFCVLVSVVLHSSNWLWQFGICATVHSFYGSLQLQSLKRRTLNVSCIFCNIFALQCFLPATAVLTPWRQ